MAKEKNLTAVTSVAAADFARVVTSAGASVKATFANVAKYIVETYNGSTVAGSAQSVKSALDSLNSNTTKHDITTYVDLASYTSTWYTFPTDGYLTASCGSASNAIAVGRVGGSSLNATFSIGGYGNSTYGSWSCFVRAGMKAQAVRLENGGTLYFRPLS